MSIIKLVTASLMAVTLQACTTAFTMENLTVTAPEVLVSPLDEALACVRASVPGSDIRFSVAQIPDTTNVFDYDEHGGYAPNGSHHMMISTLKKAGARVVNRHDVGMIEWEIDKSMARQLGDESYTSVMTKGGEMQIPYRIVSTGGILGSTHIVSGAITTLDFNRASGGFEIRVNGTGIGKRAYIMSVGIDVAVTDTISGEVVKAKSYTKSIYGVEVAGDSYRIMDSNLIDINFGKETNEPIQAGVRYTIDYIAYDLLQDMYNLGGACDEFLPHAA